MPFCEAYSSGHDGGTFEALLRELSSQRHGPRNPHEVWVLRGPLAAKPFEKGALAYVTPR